MTYQEAPTISDDLAGETRPDSPGAVAAWWLGAFAAAIAILAIAVAISHEPVTAPAPHEALVVPPGMTAARSTGPTLKSGKPEAVRKAEQASLQGIRESNSISESIVYPPVVNPPSQ